MKHGWDGWTPLLDVNLLLSCEVGMLLSDGSLLRAFAVGFLRFSGINFLCLRDNSNFLVKPPALDLRWAVRIADGFM
jgi:hypothetical protein